MEARHAVASSALSLLLIAAAVGSAIGLNTVIGGSAASPEPNGAERDICVIAEDLQTAVAAMEAASQDLSPSFEFEVDGAAPSPEPSPSPSADEAAALAELRAGGEELRQATASFVALSLEAARSAGDATAQQAFKDLAEAQDAIGGVLADAAANASSVEEFTAALFDTVFDPELLAVMTEAESAAATVEAYVASECDVSLGLSDGLDPVNSPAATDASAIGAEFAVYYVDWAEGDPQASVAAQEGVYVISGGTIITASPGVTLTNQFANSPVDWCVEVTEDATGAVFAFSSTQALVEGTCAALVV